MIEFIFYNILKFINIILMPELWIRFITVPLIIIIIALFIEYFRKDNSISFFVKIFQTIIFSLGAYIIILGIVVTSKEALYEKINQKEVIKLLLKDKNQNVYINNKISRKSDKFIKILINLKSISAHHSDSNNYMPISVSVRGDKNYLQFRLYKDSQFNYEYWVYFFSKKEKKYIYIGRIHTNIFMNKKELIKYKEENNKNKKIKNIQSQKLSNWKVSLVISFIFSLIFILVYDALFRQNHINFIMKKKYWIIFQLFLSIFIFFVMKIVLEGQLLFMGVIFLIIFITKNIIMKDFCKKCGVLITKKKLRDNETICISCLKKSNKLN